jgi:hypothetical protein
MKTTKPNNRRDFLLAAGLGGAGAVAAVVAARGVPQAAAKGEPAVVQPTGYRASAHILKYYKTTEV